MNARRLQVHKNKMELIGPSASADLTAGEQAILSALALAPGQTLARWQLMEVLSTGEESPSASALEMRIARLRKKLTRVGAETPTIKSLHKVGYTLCREVVLV
jgi:DNA-binding response OmpR family regulator